MTDKMATPKRSSPANCTYCGKPCDDIGKQMLKRRDGTHQVFCDLGCRNQYESNAEEFYRCHKK